MKKIFIVLLLASLQSCLFAQEEFNVRKTLKTSLEEYLPLINMEKPKGRPSARWTYYDGNVVCVGFQDWTSGFYPGCLWYLYEYSKDNKVKEEAIKSTKAIEGVTTYGGNHDVGFRAYCSFGNAYKLTGEDYYKDGIVTAAKTLMTRYSEKIGLIMSWNPNPKKDWTYPVIIDNMMNLELLFEATKISGDKTYWNAAVSHADKTLANHFRADNSSYHVIDYDPETGAVRHRNTHQGLNDESAWARGQAWGLYGYTVCYRYTKDKRYLDQALKIKDFYLNHPNLPEDLVPYWDFDVNGDPNLPRDVSASAIVASALVELADYAPQQKDELIASASKMLKSISDNYMNDNSDSHPNLLLSSSSGSIPHRSEINTPIIYADYYFLEALVRLSEMK
ncbi:MAG: glycoside hydrolase family 88 protein [Bacteroidales bacterium]